LSVELPVTDTRYLSLGDVVADELFPDVDLALRRGRHIDREDDAWYPFLVDAQALLELFYRRFGCELTHPADGYFYLLPTADKLGRRHLSVPEMLVGQALTLLYLDPATLQHGGVIQRSDALSHLAAVMGSEALTRAFNPKRKRVDERVAQETVRGKFAEALRRLAALGFVDLLETEQLRLRPALLRFVEPVRGRGSPAEALERLVARGELALGAASSEDAEDTEDTEDADDEDADDEERMLGVASSDERKGTHDAADAELEVARPAYRAEPPRFELPAEYSRQFDDFGDAVRRPEPAPAADAASEGAEQFDDFGEAPTRAEPPEKAEGGA
jgi:chromosome partition protein MukE